MSRTRIPAASATASAAPRRRLQLACACGSCERCRKKKVQRSAGAGATAMRSSLPDLERGGFPMPLPLRERLEPRFGLQFGDVRLHDDAASHRAARQLQAHAFTWGQHIHFGAGRFRPGSDDGLRLLAHELTHTVQQRNTAPVAAADTVAVDGPDTPLEREADAMADAVVRGAALPSVPRPATSRVQRAVQRQESETETEAAVDPAAPGAAPPEFGDAAGPEAACPRAPTNLGALRPDPPCPTSVEEVDGDRFHFCLDSDVFSSDDERVRLRGFARQQRADAVFTVHGYASRDGGAEYNRNLSCHRAKRAARELQNAGVPSHQIRIAARGPTSRFGARGADNRVVVISPASAEQRPDRTDATTPQAIVAEAVARIDARGYRLAADAYVSRWTCGVIPSVAEMVRRTTILVEGQDSRATVSRDPTQRGDPRLGHPNVPGLREIVLARETFSEAEDPVGCAQARIVDMAFHHFLGPTLGVGPNGPGVHPAALFLTELAGLAPCRTAAGIDPATGLVLVPAQDWWRRPTTDPLANRPRPCPDSPLPGPIDPQRQPARPTQPATFTVSDFSTESGEAAIRPVVDVAGGSVRARSPNRAFAFEGEVNASGGATTTARYEVGFLQTVVSDETVVEYVGGQAVHLSVPTPMRDGPPRNLAQPPWYMPPLVARPDAAGVARTRMSDSPSTGMPYEFVRPELLGRARPARAAIESGNVVNRARMRTTFHTWLAARRDDAPLDRFNTHFLRGHEVQFELDVDVVGTQATGRYRSAISSASLSDPTPMQLSGPTPAEVDPLVRTTQVTPAPPRDQAGGVSLTEWRERVRQTVNDLEPLRRALGLSGRIMLRVRVDPATGRVVITRPDRPAATLEALDGSRVSETGRQQFADAVLERIRKDLVLAPSQTSDPARVPIPTVISALDDHREPQGDPNPYAAEHGVGLLTAIHEEQQLTQSDERLANAPDTYDPDFWPRVNITLTEEKYCYDFSVSGLDISSGPCADQTLRTEGCVRPYSASSYTLRSNPTFLPQRLGTELFRSPVALNVTTFPMRFVLYTPRERPGGSTFNHEMHHMRDSHEIVQSLKDRLARRIRARLREMRRLAAENPQLKDRLLSRETIFEMVQQEEQPFVEFFQREFLGRGDRLHAWESAQGGLPPVTLPAGWRNVTPTSGARGSFTQDPC